MGTLGTLAVSIVGDASGLNKTLDGATGKFQSTGKKIGKAGGTMTRNVTAPILAAGGAALGLANKYASMGDDIAKTSTKLGVSTDALQEMQYWASQNGMESATLERAVGRLNQRIGRAADGNAKYAEAFEEVGVSLHDAQGNLRDTNDVMEDTVSALMDIEDPALRSARASEIFGTKMARDLMPALEDGSLSLEEAARQIHELGGVMSEEAVRSAEKYQDAMDDLKREFGGVFMEIGTKLIPIITDSLLPAIQNKIIPAVRNFVEWVGSLIEWFQDLSPTVQKVIGIIVGLAVVLGPILIVVGKVIAILGTLLPVLKLVGAAIMLLTSPIGIVIAAVIGLAYLIYHYWDEIKNYFISNMEETRDFFIGIWESISSIFSNALEYLKGLFFKYHPLGWIIDNWTEIKEFFAGIWESISGVFDMSLSEIWETIKGWFFAYIDFIENLMGGIENVIGSLWDSAKDKVLTAAKAIYDGVKKWFTDLAGSVGGVIRGMVNSVIQLFNSMINRLNRLSISIPDWVPVWGGRSFSPGIPNIPQLASGGDIQQAGWAMVGERGPEVLHLPEGARVTPLDGGGQDVRHSGTIRVEGVNSEGQLIAVKDIILNELYEELRG